MTRLCCSWTIATTPSSGDRASVPATTIDVGPDTQQLDGFSTEGLTGTSRQDTGPAGVTTGAVRQLARGGFEPAAALAGWPCIVITAVMLTIATNATNVVDGIRLRI